MLFWGFALVLLLTGCADASDDRSSSGADNTTGTSMASCVLRAIVDGKEWSG